MEKTYIHHIYNITFHKHTLLLPPEHFLRQRQNEEGESLPVKVQNAQLGSCLPLSSDASFSLESSISRRYRPFIPSIVDIHETHSWLYSRITWETFKNSDAQAPPLEILILPGQVCSLGIISF